MNRLSDIYYTTESYLFPMVEEEIGEITGKMKEFLWILEAVPEQRTALVRFGASDARPGKDFSYVPDEIGLRFFNHEVAD